MTELILQCSSQVFYRAMWAWSHHELTPPSALRKWHRAAGELTGMIGRVGARSGHAGGAGVTRSSCARGVMSSIPASERDGECLASRTCAHSSAARCTPRAPSTAPARHTVSPMLESQLSFASHHPATASPPTSWLPSCNHAACLGAFLVLSHSLSMSHFTASSLRCISGVAVSATSSSLWPFGSRK